MTNIDETFTHARMMQAFAEIKKLQKDINRKMNIISSESPDASELTIDYLLNVADYMKDVMTESEDEMYRIIHEIDDIAGEMADALFVSPEQ